MARKPLQELTALPNFQYKERGYLSIEAKQKLKATDLVNALNKELATDSKSFIEILAVMQGKLYRDFMNGENVKECINFAQILAKMTIMPESGESIRETNAPDKLITALKGIISEDVKAELLKKANASEEERLAAAQKLNDAMKSSPTIKNLPKPKTKPKFNLSDYTDPSKFYN